MIRLCSVVIGLFRCSIQITVLKQRDHFQNRNCGQTEWPHGNRTGLSDSHVVCKPVPVREKISDSEEVSISRPWTSNTTHIVGKPVPVREKLSHTDSIRKCAWHIL